MDNSKYLPEHMKSKRDTPQVSGRKKESYVAKVLNGRASVNSGATFGQNDVLTDHCEVEVKLTTKKSYSLKAEYFKEVIEKCDVKKMPLMSIHFKNHDLNLAVMSFEDYLTLLETIENLSSQINKR